MFRFYLMLFVGIISFSMNAQSGSGSGTGDGDEPKGTCWRCNNSNQIVENIYENVTEDYCTQNIGDPYSWTANPNNIVVGGPCPNANGSGSGTGSGGTGTGSGGTGTGSGGTGTGSGGTGSGSGDCDGLSTTITGCCDMPSGGCIGGYSEKGCCLAGGTFTANADCVNGSCFDCSNTSTTVMGCCDMPSGGCIGSYSERGCCLAGGTFQAGGSCDGSGNCIGPLGPDADGDGYPDSIDPAPFNSLIPGPGSGSIGGSGTLPTRLKEQDLSPSMEVSPNPNQGVFRLKLNNPKDGQMLLSIYDVSGKLVQELSSFVLAGEYERTITLPKSVSNGLYYISVTIGEYKFNDKIMVNK